MSRKAARWCPNCLTRLIFQEGVGWVEAMGESPLCHDYEGTLLMELHVPTSFDEFDKISPT